MVAASAAMSVGIAFAWMRPATIVHWRHAVLVLIGLVTVASVVVQVRPSPLGFRIRLDPSEEPLLPAADPARDVYHDAVRNFGDDDLLIVSMETDGAFTAEHLATLRRISEAIRRLPGVRSTDSLVDATAYRWVPEEELVEVDDLIVDVPTTPAALADLQARALGDRIYPRTIVSRDARVAAINVAFQPMSDDAFVAAGIDDSIRALLDAETTPDRRFRMAGRQHVKARAAAIMVRDVLRLIPLAVLVGTCVAWLLTGSWRAAAVPVGASLVGTIWTFGAIAGLAQPLNLITIVLGPMLICIGSVYGVHVLAHYDVVHAAIGDTAAAAVRCLRETVLPVVISVVTTVIGFAALFVSRQPAVREFALFSILGVTAMALLAVTAVPVVLAVLPPPGAARRGAAGGLARVSGAVERALERFLVAVAAIGTRRPTVVLVTAAVVTVAGAVCIPRIVVDTDYLTFFDPRSDVRRDFAAVSERLVGAVPIYLTLAGPGEGAFREPENLQALERLQREVDTVPGVTATLSVIDLLAVMNRALERGDPAAERLPATRGEIADLLFLVPKNKLRRFANTNHSRVNLLIRTGESGSAAVRALRDRLEAAIVRARLPPELRPVLTGNTIVFNEASDGIAGNQLTAMVLTAATILVLVSGALRSLRLGLIAMVPNVVPVLLFFGLLGAGLAALSLPTSLIGSVALGIAIDDTAHFLVGYRRARDGGLDPVGAATACLHEFGKPIVVTSLMLSAGYLVLLLSGFATLRQFGWLSALTMQICLWGDLLVLPALLVRARV